MGDVLSPKTICAAMHGGRLQQCEEIVTACNSSDAFPLELETSGGRFAARDLQQCGLIAGAISDIGLKLITTRPATNVQPQSPKTPAASHAPEPKGAEAIERPASRKDGAKPAAAVLPADGDYSVCSDHAATSKRASCAEFVDVCRVITGWPYSLYAASSDGAVSVFKASDVGACIQLAATLSDIGLRVAIPERPPTPEAAPASKDHGPSKAEVIEDEYMRGPDPRMRLDELPRGRSLKFNGRLRHYFSRRSRAQGEADLRRLCHTAKKEDSFLLVEGRTSGGSALSFWYEVGIHEEEQKTEAKFMQSFSKGVKADFASITTYSRYHYHPKDGYNGFGADYPSPTDFVQPINVALERKDKTMGYPAGIYDHRVVTTRGVWRLKPDFEAIRADRDGAQAQAQRYQSEFEKLFGLSLLKGGELQNCQAFARRVTSKFVEVTFHPF